MVAELYYGLELSASRERNEQTIEAGIRQLKAWPFDLTAAKEYGRIAAELKRMGRPVQKIDVMIAAVALTLTDCTVVTTDSDLSPVPGLSVEDWTR